MSNEARPRVAPYGLLSPAANVVDLTEREVDSFEYEVFCGIDISGYAVCSTNSGADVFEGQGDTYLTYKTVVANYRLKCSTMGMRPEDLRARLDVMREVQLEKFLGNELWNGTVTQTADAADVNRYLTDGNAEVLTTTAVSAREALGLVEQGIAERGMGGLGVVHVPRLLLSRLDVKADSNGVMRTEGGNIVISSTGYTTNGPEDAEGEGSWIFGTGLVTVRLGRTDIYDDMAQRFINTQNNTIELVGEQPVAVTWNDCVQVAAQVNVDGIN